MCELFGMSSAGKRQVNDLLREFFSHSVHHPHGWGMAFFYENSVSLEKEPERALDSRYLKNRLKHSIQACNMFAHIRLATVGALEYENCHPFVRRDNSGRSWTLIHNGTIFDYPPVNPYFGEQEGQTDSERILYYLVGQINERQDELRRPLEPEERFSLLEDRICDMTRGNKLNLLIFDGEYMYVHTNYKNSLHVKQLSDTALFATVPLDRGGWKLLPFARLCVYQKGRLIYQSDRIGEEYVDDDRHTRFIYMDYAGL